MNEVHKKLKEALAANGAFDPEKAAAIRKEAMAWFDRRLKWAERATCLISYSLAFLLVIALLSFGNTASTDTRQLIFWGIVFLFALQNIIRVEQIYVVANNKLNVLKELQLLRLDLAGASPAGASATGLTDVVRPYRWRRGLPWWERIAWLAAFVAIVVPILLHMKLPVPFFWTSQADLSVRDYVNLKPDGSGSIVSTISLQNHWRTPIVSFECTAPLGADVRWQDNQGRPLAARSATRDGQQHFTVELTEPILPNERASCTRILKSPALAKKQGDWWVYDGRQSYGCQTNEFSETIAVPEGMRRWLCTEESGWKQIWNLEPDQTAWVVATRGPNEPIRYSIRYAKAGTPIK